MCGLTNKHQQHHVGWPELAIFYRDEQKSFTFPVPRFPLNVIRWGNMIFFVWQHFQGWRCVLISLLLAHLSEIILNCRVTREKKGKSFVRQHINMQRIRNFVPSCSTCTWAWTVQLDALSSDFHVVVSLDFGYRWIARSISFIKCDPILHCWP